MKPEFAWDIRLKQYLAEVERGIGDAYEMAWRGVSLMEACDAPDCGSAVLAYSVAKLFYNDGSVDDAVRYAEMARAVYLTHRERYQAAEVLYFLARCDNECGLYKNAIARLRVAERELLDMGTPDDDRLLTNIYVASAYTATRFGAQGIGEYIELSQAQVEKRAAQAPLLGAASAYLAAHRLYTVKNYAAAAAKYDEARALYQALNDTASAVIMLGNVAECYAYKKEYDEAERLWLEQHERSAGNHARRAKILADLARMWAYSEEDDEKALYYANAVIGDDNAPDEHKASAHNSIAVVHLRAGNDELEKEHFEKAIWHAARTNNRSLLADYLLEYYTLTSRVFDGAIIESEDGNSIRAAGTGIPMQHEH